MADRVMGTITFTADMVPGADDALAVNQQVRVTFPGGNPQVQLGYLTIGVLKGPDALELQRVTEQAGLVDDGAEVWVRGIDWLLRTFTLELTIGKEWTLADLRAAPSKVKP